MVKLLQEEELRVLFNEGISNQTGKKKKDAKAEAEKLGLTESKREVTELLENFSSDEDDDDDDDKEDGMMYMHEEEVAVEVFREKTIEDIIEEQRAKLATEGKIGTPVTEETFKVWRLAKLAKRQAEAEARAKAELAKKKGGKGLSVLSGKELFNYNSALFVDDDAAIDAAEENDLAEQTRRERDREEAEAVMEAARAQVEQERLQQAQRLEEEARVYREEERRIQAAAKDRVTFVLSGVVINQVVFDMDEKEDLVPFVEFIETTCEAEERAPDVSMELCDEEAFAQQQQEDEDEMEDDSDDSDDDDDDDDDEDDDSDDDEDDEEEEEEEEGALPKNMSINLMKAMGMDTTGMVCETDWTPPQQSGIAANPDSLKV